MEPHEPTTHSENANDVEGDERLRPSDASSSSSTSSSEFQDPIVYSSETGRNSKKGHEKITQERREPNDEKSALQSPPTQTMERPTENSGYRIPSSVFARNKSSGQQEWSTTSNESLFSIHTGNMSFAGDKYSWLVESEDLYNVPKAEDSTDVHDAPMPEISPIQPPSDVDPNQSQNHYDSEHAIGHGSNDASTTRLEKEEDKENKSDGRTSKPSIVDEQMTPVSSRSNESGTSFAFPMLDGGGQLHKSSSSTKSVKSGPSSTPEKQDQKNKSPSSHSHEEQTMAAPEATNASTWSWFGNCMACFSCRAKVDKDAAPGSRD